MEQSEPFMRSHPHSRGNSMNEMSERGSAQGNFNDKTMQSHVQPVDDRRKGTGMGWTAETCSYIIAILALGGLVATLLVHQGKPLPQWPQLITINSVISIFSLLMRACVGVVLAEGISQCKWNWYQKADKLDHMERLDSASRGAWGSFTLLFHFRPKQAYYVAVLGALTTILASLLGFFSQQLVQFQNCLEKDTTASANILWTNSYTRVGGSIQNMVSADYPPMIAAVNIGLLQRVGDLTNVLSSGCSTGNCSFSAAGNASFSTVAISHSCEDVTTGIHVFNQSKVDNLTVNDYLGLDYGNNNTFTWSNTSSAGMALHTWMDSYYDAMSIYILSRTNAFQSDWKVFNCSLFPTVNTYEARIQGAILKERLIESLPLQSVYAQFPQPPVDDYFLSNMATFWAYQTATNYTIRNGIRESCEGSATNSSGLIMFPKSSDEPTFVNSTGQTNPSAGWKWWFYPADCIWSLHRSSRSAIITTLGEVFDDQSVGVTRRGGASGPAHLQALWNSSQMTFDSVNQTIGDLATQMTTIIRTNGGDGDRRNTSDNAEGIIWTNTTCVYVRWRWISFPAATLGLTGLFLMWILFENRGIEKDRLWKSSFLAALFCEVEMHQRPVGRKEMGAMAKSTSVSLEGNSGRLRLVAG